MRRSLCTGDPSGGCTCAGTERRYCRRPTRWRETDNQRQELARLEADLLDLKRAERARSRPWLAKVARRWLCPDCGRAFFPASLVPDAAAIRVCPACRAALSSSDEKKVAA